MNSTFTFEYNESPTDRSEDDVVRKSVLLTLNSTGGTGYPTVKELTKKFREFLVSAGYVSSSEPKE